MHKISEVQDEEAAHQLAKIHESAKDIDHCLDEQAAQEFSSKSLSHLDSTIKIYVKRAPNPTRLEQFEKA